MFPSLEVPATSVKRILRADFVRHGILVFAASMLTNVLNYLFNFAVSHRVGVENFATLSSLTSAVMILSIPASIANLMVVKYAADFKALNEDEKIAKLALLVLRAAVAFAAFLLVVGLALRKEMGAFLNIQDEASIILTLFVLAFAVVSPSLRGVLQGRQDFRRFSVSLAIESLLKTGLAIVLVYAGFGVSGAMAGWAIGTLTAAAYTMVVSGALRRPVATVALSLDYRRLATTAMGVGLGSGMLTLFSFMDMLLVKHYFPPHDAGLYAAANMTGKIVLFVVGFVPMVLLPKAVEAVRRGQSALPLLIQSAGSTIVLSGSILGAFGLMPHRVVTLLAGPAFGDAAPYVFQYDAAMVLLAVLTVLVNYKIGIHRFGFLYPLGIALIAEIVTITLVHRSLWDVIHVLLLGNGAVCAALLFSSLRWERGFRTASRVAPNLAAGVKN